MADSRTLCHTCMPVAPAEQVKLYLPVKGPNLHDRREISHPFTKISLKFHPVGPVRVVGRLVKHKPSRSRANASAWCQVGLKKGFYPKKGGVESRTAGCNGARCLVVLCEMIGEWAGCACLLARDVLDVLRQRFARGSGGGENGWTTISYPHLCSTSECDS
eukprot:scaffold32834_cov152-Isochrysis_galbana.AAC.1